MVHIDLPRLYVEMMVVHAEASHALGTESFTPVEFGMRSCVFAEASPWALDATQDWPTCCTSAMSGAEASRLESRLEEGSCKRLGIIPHSTFICISAGLELNTYPGNIGKD